MVLPGHYYHIISHKEELVGQSLLYFGAIYMPLFIPVISRGKTEAHLPVKYLLSAGCGLPDEYSVNQHPSFFSSLNFQNVRFCLILRILISDPTCHPT